MRAVVIHQFGDPKLLQVEEVPTPQPREGEALVEVKAAGINPSDVKNIQGAMHGTTLPRIPGRDFAGVVVQGPADLLGKEVWGTGGDIGFTRDGSHAQFILLPVTALTPKPVGLSMDQAGTAGVTYVTAWSAMVTAAHVEQNDRVLIVGATGGVGSSALQIAKARGAAVLAAVRSDQDAAHAHAHALGADEVINTTTANLPEAVRTLTQGDGVNIAFDTTGQMFAQCVESAARGGRIPVISAPPDGNAAFNLRTLYRQQLIVMGVDTRKLDAVACAKLLAQMLPDFEAGRFTVSPGQPRPLAAAPEVYDLAGHGKGRFYFRPQQ